jgi:tetratricopeptide (TPR) repeat protein
MSRSIAMRLLLSCCVITALFTGCSRDPNVRKQKYFDSGEKYFAESKYREAVIQYLNAVQIDPRFAQAHYQLSQAYLKLGDKNHAFQELNRTVELAPDNYHAQADLADLLSGVRNPDGSVVQDALKQAKTHLDWLREKQPNTPETHEAGAYYDLAQRNLGPAIQEAQQAIALAPNRSESYLLLALIQLQSNLPDQAEASYKKAVQVDPKSMNAQLLLGSFYASHNRLAEAEQQFKHAIEMDPKDPAPRAALVPVLMQEGKKNDIESFLRQTKKDLAGNPEGYRMLGDYYYAVGDLDKAVAEFASVHEEHPKDIRAKKNYIQLLILKNRLQDATQLNNEILKSNPHDVDGLICKGQIQIAQGDPAGAVESLQGALRNDPDNATAHYHMGIAYSQQGDAPRAESEWRAAVHDNPNLIQAQKALATLELGRGENQAALDTAQQVVTAEPYSGDGYLLRSQAELQSQNYSEAQHDSEEAMKRAPQSPAPYIELGAIQFAQKHFAEAEKFYQQALEKDPSSTNGLSGLMHIYVAQKNYDKAIAAANAQIAKAPQVSNFYDLLATALYDGKKDYPGAHAALQKAIDLDKNNVDAIEKLGRVEVQQHNLDQALSLYLNATKTFPREVRFFILAGQLYSDQQNWDQAKAMYQQALSLSPDNPLASNNLAYVILEQGGNVDVAMNMAQAARRGMPDSPSFADTLGWAYYHKGIYQSAINQFQEALRLNEKNGGPDDAVVHYHLGLAYQKANQTSLARQQLEKALKLSPDNADARKALSELRS